MIKKSVLVLLICACPVFGMFAQGTILSDRVDLADTVLINQSLELANQFYDDFESDSSLFYAERALNLSKRLFYSQDIESNVLLFNRMKALMVESYVIYARALRDVDNQAAEDTLLAVLDLLQETDTAEKAAIYSHLGITYERREQFEKALRYNKMALEIFQALGDQNSYMDQLVNTGLVLRGMGNYGESLEYFVESLKTGRELNDSTAIVESLLAMGFVYAFAEKWDDALSSQREALKIYQESNNQWGIARIHNDMGVTYDLSGKFDSSLVHHKAALALRLGTNDTYNTFSSYLYIGDIHAQQGNITEAIEYYEKGLSYRDQVGYLVAVVDAYLKLGDYYLELPNVENAKTQYKASLRLSEEIDDPTGIARGNMALAQIAIQRGEYDKAIAMLKIAGKTMPESSLQMKEEMYQEISETYFKLGDYKNAYLNSLIYSDVKDSVLSAANLSKITQMTNVMAFENELALKRESNEKIMAIKQAEINREKFTRNIFLAGMIFAVVLVGITFFRFIEKKKLSNKLNDTLNNLKSAQKQLIHSEKMASLGELTAGIAHEIQNPLNFVNNFAEVSGEMVEEVKEEIRSQNSGVRNENSGDRSQNSEVLELLDDIGRNLAKINHHGKRADSIIKGMLQHSRGGSGQMEPTDLNGMIKEFVNLSFHGMRAGKEPINVDIQLELDEEIGKVPMIAEDFSRVIVNLCNNGFDAMRGKLKNSGDRSQESEFRSQNSGGFAPKLIARTKLVDDKIHIEIEDNGPGIPEEIKEKILQPFFTTKKGTEGTGLGLSISNDIVMSHGGTMEVHSEPGQTVFSIILKG